ncbi:NifU homolog involved in Fe-S cluster formation [Fontimonas thermophila]|uniref:NifU homolog involved in Fe-S cluster formation n=1 Tax=Fontimonas thermophila TaxID=1076937 RepID=A0A1I2JI71_9GAMM|nr:iron-sulfur cluster assembly scaffold protein [Fontimonas thermophila]SFF54542.1 NifU homolog involved in Fe-S cluster formation [Fontimonas thermophila]
MNETDNVYAYPQAVWMRFRDPRHAGVLEGHDVRRVYARTPAASAVIELSIAVGPPLRVRFRAHGCPYTIAVGEWLAETLEREGLADLDRWQAGSIRQALEIPEERTHCALMGEDLIRALESVVKSSHPSS